MLPFGKMRLSLLNCDDSETYCTVSMTCVPFVGVLN